MKEELIAQTPKPAVLVLIDGKEVPFNRAQFQERYGVEGWVRIPSDEFGNIEMKDGRFGHFNFGNANHKVDKKYLVIKIQASGAPATGTEQEKPPLLSEEGAFVVRCTQVDTLRLDSVTQEHFNYPVLGAHDKESVEKIIRKRYPTARSLSDEQFKEKELTYTLFKKIERSE